MPRISSRYTLPLAASPVAPSGVPASSLYTPQLEATPRYGDSQFPESVSIDRLWSGIHIEWTSYGQVLEQVKIVRKRGDYPYTIIDGVTVYEGPSSVGFFDDTTATGPDTYYYVLWFKDLADPVWETKYWTRIWEVALGPNTTPELLWSMLPTMYRRTVDTRDNSTDLNTLINYVIAPVLRETESLTEFFPKLLDVDETPGPYLKSMAHYVGLEPNLELTYLQQREEIKAAVSSYRKKGLKETIARMASAISGVEVTVVDYNQHILFRDWPERVRLNLDNPFEGYNFLQPGDVTFSRPTLGQDDYYDFAAYGVYLHLESQGLESRTVAKLLRALSNFAPVYSHNYIWAMVQPAVEVYDISTEITETSWVEIDHYDEESIVVNYLVRDSLGSLRDDIDTPRLIDWPMDSGSGELST